MNAQPVAGQPAALPPSWWAGGLALHERLPAPERAPSGPAADQARDRLARWRQAHGLAATGQFGTRLAALGLSEGGLLALLAEPPGELAARTGRPAWAGTVEQALTQQALWAGGEDSDTSEDSDDSDTSGDEEEAWPRAFAVPLRAFVALARARIVAAGTRYGCTRHGDQGEVAVLAGAYTGALRDWLVRTAARTFVLELNLRRVAGSLAGADPAARFADFVDQVGTPAGLGALLRAYPVLARLLGQATDQCAEAAGELLARYHTDRARIVATLLGGADPGPLVAVEPARGDAHRGGRAVAVLRFAGGRQVVYKPREVRVQQRFAGLVERLNAAVPGLELRAVRTLTCDGYGWLEYVAAGPCADAAAADRFYHRLGALLALLHITHAADVHCENLIAAGDQPVLVDLETLFHPAFPLPAVSPDPAARALAASVYRTALLPLLVVGERGAMDLSGLGGDRDAALPNGAIGWSAAATDRMRLVRREGTYGGALNRPRLGEREVDPAEHQQSLLAGFRTGYAAVLRARPAFTELLRGFAGDEVRFVIRPTMLYARLLDESTHPDVLRDGLDRDRLLDLLWAGAQDDPLRTAITPNELVELWSGDVPCFSGQAGSRELRDGTGRLLASTVDRSGLESALAAVAGLSELDLREQEWIIAAALATRQAAGTHRTAGLAPWPTNPTPADPQRLLAAACGIADRIGASAIHGSGRVNWLGLELVDDAYWQVLPMGAGLATGYTGVALFLAELAKLTGVARYTELARLSVQAVGPLLEGLGDHPGLVRDVGSGGLYGLGGVAYALARLATLTGSAALAGWAATAVELMAGAAGREEDGGGEDGEPFGTDGWAGFATGAAGRLAAMCAVHAELGLPAAARLARGTADQLATMLAAGQRAGHRGAPPAGFATGTAGAAWALLRFSEEHPGADHRYLDAARAALRPPQPTHPGRGWCSGLAGILTARAYLPAADRLAEPTTPHFGAGPDAQLATLLGAPPTVDLSLCHGELGTAEALTVVATRAGDPRAAAALPHRAALILGLLDRYGPRCGTPTGVPTAGTLMGLAGIGYGLLRLGYTEQVPSLLLLGPTPAGG